MSSLTAQERTTSTPRLYWPSLSVSLPHQSTLPRRRYSACLERDASIMLTQPWCLQAPLTDRTTSGVVNDSIKPPSWCAGVEPSALSSLCGARKGFKSGRPSNTVRTITLIRTIKLLRSVFISRLCGTALLHAAWGKRIQHRAPTRLNLIPGRPRE